ncbi:MAG: phosphate/phosphite/phosphonate ABC transporter substrate-binding protein [Cycloclasticus sp.]|nr:phosphate/phosphite/phosphonate ABC transporter substrate-binding protein [Cycloclasticus sp.]
MNVRHVNMTAMLSRLKWLPLLLFLSNGTVAGEVYSVGIVPQFESRQITHIWQPILKEVSRRSNIQLELKASPNMVAFEKQLKEGVFDFAYMNPYQAVTSQQMQGYMPLLNDNGRKLFGIIVVKKDSPIRSVQELDGQQVAFPSATALGATLLTRAELARKFNITLNGLYVKSHSSAYLNVITGTAIAGGGVQNTLLQQPDAILNKLRVLYTTDTVPSHPISAHPRVLPPIQAAIQQTFLDLGNDKKGRQLLANIPIKKIGPATISDYEPIKNLNLETFLTGVTSQ